jgi:hypothetical protein
MVMAVHQGTVTDGAGNVVPGATISVQREVPGLPPAAVFADRDGTTPLGSSFPADGEGYYRFYAVGGRYRITATSGAFSRAWQDVAIGTAQGLDILQTGFEATPRGAWDPGTTYALADLVELAGFNYVSNQNGNLNNEPDDAPASDAFWTFLSGVEGPPGPPGPMGIGINYRNGWLTATAYDEDDAVTHGGSLYVCIDDHTSGSTTEPGVGVDWETVWELAVSKGDPGPPGGGGGSGDVVGPDGGVTDGHAAVFDGTTGKLIRSAGGVPSLAGHGHVISDVTGLGDALNAKVDDDIEVIAGAGLTGGGDLTVNRTLDVGAGTGILANTNDVAVDKAAVADIRAAVNNKVITADGIETASAFVVLSDANPPQLDWDAGINRTLEITTNRTLANPTNGQPGTWRTIYVTSDDGPDTLGFNSQYIGPAVDGDPLDDIEDGAKAYLLTILCITTTLFFVAAAPVEL